MNEETQLPTREQFIAYWEKEEKERHSWRGLLPYAMYLGGLALYTAIVRFLDPGARFGFVCAAIAVVYVIAVPWVTIVRVQKRYASLIRCPQCGDWLGRDLSGDWYGTNPNWKLVGQTGQCTKCGRQLDYAWGRTCVVGC